MGLGRVDLIDLAGIALQFPVLMRRPKKGVKIGSGRRADNDE